MIICFQTLGCKLNFAETSDLGKALLQRGHQRCKKGEQADVCVLNTCSVTDAADHKGRLAIHRLHREHPNATIIVTGCYAQLKPQEIAAIDGVDYVLGSNDKFQIPQLIDQLEANHTITPSFNNDTFFPAYSREDRTRCFLKVQDGCNYFCTYCTIPFARGRSRNGTIASVLRQAQNAINEGAKEIVLTGVNIGDFGRTTNETFIDLLRALDNIDANVRYRISSCEPNLLSDEIIEFVAQSNHFAPHFHIPLQSGSNEVLKIMQRRYTRELFQERVEHIKSLMPDAFIGVDCMVGVRGETEEYFDDYYHFVEALPISQLHVFTYSERQNTRMLSMNLLVVPQKIRKQRSEILHQLSEKKLADFYQSQNGKTKTVLWESKREGQMMSGFTENYVRQQTPYNADKINTFEQIICTIK